MVEVLLQTMVNAVYAASFMALIAVGLVLIFGVMGVINFTHGEFYILGAYMVAFAYGGQGMPFLLAIGLVFNGILGLVAERALFRPWRGNPLGGPIVSIGLLLVLQAAVATSLGVRAENVPSAYRTIVPLTEGVGIHMPPTNNPSPQKCAVRSDR